MMPANHRLKAELEAAVDEVIAERVTAVTKSNEGLAQDVLTMAASGGMPDTFWLTDQRILRACDVLGWTPERAREWAHEQGTRR